MTDYISREAAIAESRKEFSPEYNGYDHWFNLGVQAVISRLEKANSPINLVEVIRCKDCRHFHPDDKWVGGTYYGCDAWEGRDGCDLEVEEDDFCSRAERCET